MEFSRRLRRHVLEFEKLRLKPEHDEDGALIIGLGRRLDDKGISSDEAYVMLSNDFEAAHVDMIDIFEHSFYSFPDNIKLVLMDLRLSLGSKEFRRLGGITSAARRRQWGLILREIVNLPWYKKNCLRATALIRLIDLLIPPPFVNGGTRF